MISEENIAGSCIPGSWTPPLRFANQSRNLVAYLASSGYAQGGTDDATNKAEAGSPWLEAVGLTESCVDVENYCYQTRQWWRLERGRPRARGEDRSSPWIGQWAGGCFRWFITFLSVPNVRRLWKMKLPTAARSRSRHMQLVIWSSRCNWYW